MTVRIPPPTGAPCDACGRSRGSAIPCRACRTLPASARREVEAWPARPLAAGHATDAACPCDPACRLDRACGFPSRHDFLETAVLFGAEGPEGSEGAEEFGAELEEPHAELELLEGDVGGLDVEGAADGGQGV